MSSFKPIDGTKEDFRKYLDRKGVLDAITKVLIKCNSDRPENAIEYLLDNLGEKLKDKDTIGRLENELNDARNEIEALKRELNNLKLTTATNSKICKEETAESSIEAPVNKEVESTATMPAANGSAEQIQSPSTSVTADEKSEPATEPKETGSE